MVLTITLEGENMSKSLMFLKFGEVHNPNFEEGEHLLLFYHDRNCGYGHAVSFSYSFVYCTSAS